MRRLRDNDPIWAWWNKAAPAAEVLPLELENGQAIVELTGCCKRCKIDVPQDRSRIELRNRCATTYWMRMVIVCAHCRTASVNVYSIGPADDGGISIIDVTDEEPDVFDVRALAPNTTEGRTDRA